MGFLKKFTKQEISWMMYDWANSAHSVIVVTILPIFFDSVASYTADSVSSMSIWGYATSHCHGHRRPGRAVFGACLATSAACAKSCSRCLYCWAWSRWQGWPLRR